MTSSKDNADNEWETATYKADVVNTPTGRMFLVTQGPARQHGQPVVVLEAGAGETGAWWNAVARKLTPTTRVYHYDRAGLGRSDVAEGPRDAENMAAQLHALLDAANVPPPFIVAAHSFGGVIIREFLATYPPGSIVGMVLVDCNTEKTMATLEIPEAASGAVMEDMDYWQVTGMNEDHCYTSEERERIKLDGSMPNDSATSAAEMKEFASSAEALAKKDQLAKQALSNAPLTVIRGNAPKDISRMFAHACERQLGTAEQRAEIQKFLDHYPDRDLSLQKEQMRLSSNSRFVQAEGSGHHVHTTEAELVAQEILKIVELCE